MYKRYLVIFGGIITSISMFFPFFSYFGISPDSGIEMGDRAYFTIIMGIAITIIGLYNSRWSYILSLALASFISTAILIRLNIYNGSPRHIGATIGIGPWILLTGSIMSLVGSLLRILKEGNRNI